MKAILYVLLLCILVGVSSAQTRSLHVRDFVQEIQRNKLRDGSISTDITYHLNGFEHNGEELKLSVAHSYLPDAVSLHTEEGEEFIGIPDIYFHGTIHSEDSSSVVFRLDKETGELIGSGNRGDQLFSLTTSPEGDVVSLENKERPKRSEDDPVFQCDTEELPTIVADEPIPPVSDDTDLGFELFRTSRGTEDTEACVLEPNSHLIAKSQYLT